MPRLRESAHLVRGQLHNLPFASKAFCFGPRSTLPGNFSAMSVNALQEEGGKDGVWLRVRILNSLVFNLRTIVRAGVILYATRTKAFLPGAGSLVRVLIKRRLARRCLRWKLILSAGPGPRHCRPYLARVHVGADCTGRN